MIEQVLLRWVRNVMGSSPQEQPIHSIRGLTSGTKFCRFVEHLTGKRPLPAAGDDATAMKAAFTTIGECGMSRAALTCTADEVVEGCAIQLLVSLLWDLAEEFSISRQFPDSKAQWKASLLAWCQSLCQPKGVNVTDFHKSFQDGLAFCAMISSAVEDKSLITLDDMQPQNAAENLSLSFSVAQHSLGVVPVLDASEVASSRVPDERGIILYLSLLHTRIAQGAVPKEHVVAAQQGLSGFAGLSLQGHQHVDSTAESLRRAALGRPHVPGGLQEGISSSISDEVARVMALIEELRDPINQVAEVLETSSDELSHADAKATFNQLTERMRRLAAVLPDTLEATEEAQALEQSIQVELRKVRARAEFEQAYITRLIERQQQCRAMSTLLQDQVSDQFEKLRRPVMQLMQLLDSNEIRLKKEIMQVEHDKIAILTQSQRTAEMDLERMHTAEMKADTTLKSKIVSPVWLETGHNVERILVGCEAGRIEGKTDFPGSFTDFNCTLDLRSEHNVVTVCEHTFKASDFEERKILDGNNFIPTDIASKLALSTVNRDSQEHEDGTDSRRGTWSMTPEGDWVRGADPAVLSGGMPTVGSIERVLAYAKKLPAKEADEFLSQDFVRAILLGSEKPRQSDRVLLAAYHEANGRAPPMGGISGDYTNLGGHVLSQLVQDPSSTRATPPPAAMQMTSSTQPGTSVLVIGGWDGIANLNSCECFSHPDHAHSWAQVGTMSSSRRGLAAVKLGGRVYVMGGWDGTSYLDSVEVLDVSTGKWSPCSCMLHQRCFAAAAVMGGKIYVVGGYYGSQNLETAEVFDPEKNTWSQLPSMACPRRGLAVACLNGNLYAIGGWDGKRNVGTVECYSAQTGCWRAIESLTVPRCSACCTVLDGRLYVLGGWDGNKFLDSVEYYEPIYGTSQNPMGPGEWRQIAPMRTPRSYAASIALGGRLVVMGGWDGVSARRLDSVESYDPKANAWVSLPSMCTPRYGLAAVVV